MRNDLSPQANNREYLTAKELAFVDAMIAGANSPKAAAATAGYHEGYCGTIGPALMKRPQIAEMVREGLATARAIVAERTGIQLADVVQRIAEIAMRDPAAMFDENGAPRPLDEIPVGLRACIEGLDVEKMKDRGVVVGEVVKYKLAKPTVALDMLMRHLGGYELDNRQQSDPLIELLREINGRAGRNRLTIVGEVRDVE
jgi:phage terminase small subunit